MWIPENALMNRTQEGRNKCFLARVAFKSVRIDIQDTMSKEADLAKKEYIKTRNRILIRIIFII